MKTKRVKKNSLTRNIAKARTVEERIRFALFGRTHTPEGVERLVDQWATVRWYRADGQRIAEDPAAFESFAAALAVDTKNFAVSAMVHNRPDLLIALADEMKRKNDSGDWQPAVADAALLRYGKAGPVNLSRLAVALAEREKAAIANPLERQRQIETRTAAIRKTLGRKAKAYRIKPAPSGAPAN